jgi:ribosomal protein S6--L-glutamate ligase
MQEKVILGSEEWCSFPELDIPTIKARVDSGKNICVTRY